jgi:hypothetical protein
MKLLARTASREIMNSKKRPVSSFTSFLIVSKRSSHVLHVLLEMPIILSLVLRLSEAGILCLFFYSEQSLHRELVYATWTKF